MDCNQYYTLPFSYSNCFIWHRFNRKSLFPGLIYVVGGIGNEGIELCSVEVYDPISKRWSTFPGMGTRRAYLGVAALNDCIYAVGGWNETQGALSTVEKYTFEEVRLSTTNQVTRLIKPVCDFSSI